MEQLPDVLITTACDRIMNGEVGVDRVLIAATVPLACDVADVTQLNDDAVHGTFRDPNPLCDFA
jgi:hypothetical protein